MLKDADHWGIPPECLPEEDTADGIWPENLPAVQAFLSVCSQWRTLSSATGGTHWLGLDYTAVDRGFALAGIEMSPDLWDRVQLIEAGACSALNGEPET